MSSPGWLRIFTDIIKISFIFGFTPHVLSAKGKQTNSLKTCHRMSFGLQDGTNCAQDFVLYIWFIAQKGTTGTESGKTQFGSFSNMWQILNNKYTLPINENTRLLNSHLAVRLLFHTKSTKQTFVSFHLLKCVKSLQHTCEKSSQLLSPFKTLKLYFHWCLSPSICFYYYYCEIEGIK